MPAILRVHVIITTFINFLLLTLNENYFTCHTWDVNYVSPWLSKVGYCFLAENKGCLSVDIHAAVEVIHGKGGSIARDDYPSRVDEDIQFCNDIPNAPCYWTRWPALFLSVAGEDWTIIPLLCMIHFGLPQQNQIHGLLNIVRNGSTAILMQGWGYV